MRQRPLPPDYSSVAEVPVHMASHFLGDVVSCIQDFSTSVCVIRTAQLFQDSLIIPWNKTVNLPQERREKIREMFQGVLDLVPAIGTAIKRC